MAGVGGGAGGGQSGGGVCGGGGGLRAGHAGAPTWRLRECQRGGGPGGALCGRAGGGPHPHPPPPPPAHASCRGRGNAPRGGGATLVLLGPPPDPHWAQAIAGLAFVAAQWDLPDDIGAAPLHLAAAAGHAAVCQALVQASAREG
eukprot:115895-Prorocentrum_minimum.AAC.1